MVCGGYSFDYQMECYAPGFVSIYHGGGDYVPLDVLYIGWMTSTGSLRALKSANIAAKCDPLKTSFAISDTLHISYDPSADSIDTAIYLYIKTYSGGEYLCGTLSPLLYDSSPVKC